MKSLQAVAVLAMTLALLSQAAYADKLRAAVFPFELYDTSLQGAMQGPRKDEQLRLQHLDTQLAELLAKSGKYQPLSVANTTGETLRTCDGCEVDLARKAGAQVSVIGWVQKVSDLILNINIVMRSVATGKMVHAGSVDIRGNTDESWSRGIAYLMRYRILADLGASQ